MASSPYDASKKRPILGASHTPRIRKGAYNVGSSPTGRLDYNRGPVPWQTNIVIPSASAQEIRTIADVLEEIDRDDRAEELSRGTSMCGDCIGTMVLGGHDPQTDKRRVCRMCSTIWPGLEPDNDRRGAIRAQKEKNR